jgi:phage FluMu gp28-like protein
VQRVVSTGGNVTYTAPRNADGHSDRAAALALAIRAAHTGAPVIPPFGSGRIHNPDRRRL